MANMTIPRNYWLYARILRLTHLMSPCLGADGSDLNDIVRDVIVPDAQLVWC
jgi:hypothetical protein